MDAASLRPRLVAVCEAGRREGLHLLLHSRAPRWIAVNAVGLAVAQRCDGAHSVQEIAAEVARRWSQPIGSVLADVEAYIAQLAQAGFLEDFVGEAPSPAKASPRLSTSPPSPPLKGEESITPPSLLREENITPPSLLREENITPPSLSGKGAGGLGYPAEKGAGGLGYPAAKGAGGLGHPAGKGTEGSGAAAGTGSRPPAPWRLHLDLTDACNLRCLHCGIAGNGDGRTHLDAALARDLIGQAAAAGAEGIAFSGGEPLLHPDLLALLACAAPRLKTLLATNAHLIDDEAAAALVRLGVIVQVSLDGADAATHDRIRGVAAFERTWRGIERLQRAGIGERLALNVTLMRPNIGQVAEIVALAERRGIPAVRFTALQRMGRAAGRWAGLAPTADEYAEAYRYLYRYRSSAGLALSPELLGLEPEPPEQGLWCGLGRTLLVNARGDVYPCGLFVGPQFRLGNVRDTPLADALASPALAHLIGRCERRRETIAECRACAWQHFCQAGCAGSVWHLHGTLDATDGLCAVRRELFAELMIARATAYGIVRRIS
ncbi:MAG: PqqD family peptide modification chaperone [Anaerolineae bacterium]